MENRVQNSFFGLGRLAYSRVTGVGFARNQALTYAASTNQTVSPTGENSSSVFGAPKPKPPKKPTNRRTLLILIAIVLLLLVGGGIFAIFAIINNQKTPEGEASQFESVEIPLNDILTDDGLNLVATRSLTVNGQLKVNDSLIVSPSGQPSNATAGQLYFDQTTDELTYFNGTEFVGISAQETGVGISNQGGVLSNTGVLSLQGQTGTVSLTAGAGIAINGTTITNSGVTSLGGTTGAITIGDGLAMSGGELRNDGVNSLTSGSLSLIVTDDGAGNLTISSVTGGGTVTSGGGTNGRIAKFTSAQNIENSLLSESGTVVTVNGDLGVTGNLSLTNALSVSNGGTGATSLTNNGVLVGQGAGALTAVTGSPGQCLLATAGAPSFGVCPGAGGVVSINGQTGAVTIANASAAAGTVTINNASTSQKGIAQFNNTNFSDDGNGTINTIQNIATTSSPTFTNLTATGNVNANTVQTNGTLRIDSSGNLANIGNITASGNATLQGGSISVGTNVQAGSVVLNDGSSNTGTLRVGALGQNTVYTLPDPGSGNVDVCLTTGNCAGTGTGVTTSGGATNTIPKFTASQNIENSTISDNGTVVTTSADAVIQGGDLTVGSTTQIASLLLHDGGGQATTLQAGNSSGDLTFILPTNTGAANQCLKQSGAGNQLFWDNCDGGGGGSSATLQIAYNNGNTIITTDARDIGFSLSDTATDSNFLVDIQCDTSCGSNGRFAVQDDGADMFSVSPGGLARFNSNVDLSLSETENLNISSSVSGTNSVNAQEILLSNSTSSGTQNGLFVQNQDGSGATESLVSLDNGDGDNVLNSALRITDSAASAGTLNAIDASDGAILNAINVGPNNIVGTTGNIDLSNFDVVGASGNVTIGGTLGVTGTTTLTGDLFANGSSTIGSDNADLLTINAVLQGATPLVFEGATADANELSLAVATLTADRTITLPDETGTVCLQNSTACGFATSAAAFIQNGNSFGAATVLGTNDANSLAFETSGATRLTIAADGSNVTLASGTDLLLQGAAAYVSNPQGTLNSEVFGLNASTNDSRNVVVGNGATITGNSDSVAIGYNATTSDNSVSIGAESNCTGNACVTIGRQAVGAFTSTALGNGATSSNNGSIALGNNATTTAANQMVVGSSGTAISQVVIGNGVTNATPTSLLLQTTSGSGSNISGGSTTLAGGQSTGNASGGNVLFQISTPGGSGSSQNALSTVGTFSGGNGSFTLQNSANSSTGFQVQNASGATLFAVDTTSGNIDIGQSNTTGTLLVLDTKTDAGDPTGENGGIYYNSNTGKFRCFEASAWKDCITAGSVNPFIQDGNSFGAAAVLGTNDANSLAFETSGTTRMTIAANGANVTMASGTDLLLQGTTAYISNPQAAAGNENEAFGLNANSSAGFRNVTVGNGATTGSINNSVAIGRSASASAGGDSVAIGETATCGNSSCVAVGQSGLAAFMGTALGYDASANQNEATAIGSSSVTGGTESIALGSGATTTAANQMVIGSSTAAISQVYLGNGVTNASPAATIFQGTGGSGLNVAGAAITIAGGQGTGTGNGGNINFNIADPGSSGSGLNGLSNVMRLRGSDGAANFQNSTDSATGFSVLNVAGTPQFRIDTSASRVYVGNPTGDTIGTVLVLDTKTDAGDPTGVAGAMYYSTNTNKFRCFENSAWTDCISSSSGLTMQSTYTNSSSPANITTTDGKDINFDFADTTTDANFLIDLQCDTSCGANGRFAVQDDGTDVMSIAPNGGAVTLRNSSNSSNAFSVMNAAGSAILGVDTTNSNVNVSGNLAGSQGFEGVTFPPASPGTWTTGGNVAWSRTTSQFQEGTASAQTGAIGDSQTSFVDLDYTFTADGVIKFYWKASTEGGFDYLFFCVDNDACSSPGSYNITGTVDWTEVTVPVNAGAHSFRWTYARDSCCGAGTNQGWLDNVRLYEGGNLVVGGKATASRVGAGTGTPEAQLHAVGSTILQSGGGQDPLSVRSAAGNEMFDIDPTGRATFKNGSDTTTAFQVVNAATSMTLLNIDTVTNYVTTDGQIEAVGNIQTNSDLIADDQLFVVGTSEFYNNAAIRDFNSTEALMVMNSTAVRQFVVDSTNSRVYIGNPTADSVGALLILDTKNTSGDPTGIAGGMYYNSNRQTMRCFENGFWRDCIESSRTALRYRSELMNSNNESPWEHFANNGGGRVALASEANHPGIVRMETNTSAAGNAGFGIASTNDDNILLGNGDIWRHEIVSRIPTLSDGSEPFIIRTGLMDGYDSDGVDGCFFKYTHSINSGEWEGICRSNSTSSTCDTNLAASAGAWTRLTAVVSSSSLATFYINGTSACTVTTNIPTGSGRQVSDITSITKTGSTANRTFEVDYIEAMTSEMTPR